jgi:hypothetical protein
MLMQWLIESILVMLQQVGFITLGFVLFRLELNKKEMVIAALLGTAYSSIFMILFTLQVFSLKTHIILMYVQTIGTVGFTLLALGLRSHRRHIYFTLLFPYLIATKIIAAGIFFIPRNLDTMYYRGNETMLITIGIAAGLTILCRLTHFKIIDFSEEETLLKYQKKVSDFLWDIRTR